MLADFLSKSIWGVAVEEDEERKIVMEQLFSKEDKKGLEMADVTAMVDRNVYLEEPLGVTMIFLGNTNGVSLPICLRRQSKKHKVKISTCANGLKQG